MPVKILILELDTICERIEDLHDFWDDFISFLTMTEYGYVVEAFHEHPDFLKKVSPCLYNLAPTLESILKIGDEEWKEELIRIHKRIRGEIKRLWDNSGEIIINSYENLIYDITGSDEIREIYRREVVEPIMAEMENIKRVFGWRIKLNNILFESTTEWFKEIEKLVMGG